MQKPIRDYQMPFTNLIFCPFPSMKLKSKFFAKETVN